MIPKNKEQPRLAKLLCSLSCGECVSNLPQEYERDCATLSQFSLRETQAVLAEASQFHSYEEAFL